MKIKMMPAQYGDCFWIYTSDKINILVDGGLKSTYNHWIKPLTFFGNRYELIFDLVIVTHIDCDHIGGIVAFLEDCEKNCRVGLKEIWHNGLFQIGGKKFLEYSERDVERDEEILNAIIQRGYLSSEDSNIGVSESFALDVLIQEKKVVRNLGDKNSAICDKTGEYDLGILTKILVLGPDKESLNAMEKYWQKEMIARNYRFQVTNRVKLMQAFEFQMSAVNNYYAPFELQISGKDCIERYLSDLEDKDISVTNRSSICFVIEEGKYKVLFLGDAVIYNNGSLMKRLEEKYGRTCHFTAIKLPHHGSRYNVSIDFIKRYTSLQLFTKIKIQTHLFIV